MTRTASECQAWLSALVVALMLTAPAPAQMLPGEAPPRRYVPFEIDKDFESALKERLKMERQLGPLKDLVKQIAADPSKFPVDPKDLKGLQLDDLKKKEALKGWLANDPELQQALKDWVKQNAGAKEPEKVKELKQLQEILDESKRKPIELEPNGAPNGPPALEPDKLEGETIGKLTERAMKRAEDTRLGDWLRDSPAWNRAFSDLRSQANAPEASDGKPNFWQEKLRAFEGDTWKLGEGSMERLKELSGPNLGRLKGALPRSVPTPNLTVPGMPDFAGPSLPSVSAGMMWVLLLALFMLAGWLMLRWRKRRAETASLLARLGPWPVRPETVSTRAELVRAFDYLALLTLGLAVQSWNHQAIARRWRDRAPSCAESARTLALLYEQARYTEGAEELTDIQRDLARRSLLQLKEAF